EAPLRRLGWLRLEADDPYQPLRATPALLARVCGRPAEPTPPPGASPVPGHAGWDDLVLPASRLAMLQEFLLWITQRDTVVGRWGGRAHGGPVALFAGPSGTGKTLAASVIASALGWRLYRVDLGRLVSKYVGETEQNLNRLFDAAEGQPMVLQFDEADALFAKRGEVKEARDRYANLEVSHLLTRIEAHDGPCILTTNLRKQLDPAFTRRFQMVVEFPRPDAPARAELWRRLLPPQAPRSADLDPVLLGEAVALSGGSIRNAALHAAFLAAAQGQPIGLGHVAHAVWRELAKEGRELSPQDLGPLARHLPPELRDEA
ncbi:ATP-binding protein, partial [Ideonella dechloratans]